MAFVANLQLLPALEGILSVGVEFLKTLEGLLEAAEWERKRGREKGERREYRQRPLIGKKTWMGKLQMFKAESSWVSAEWNEM